jgi:hypothetical protein
VFRFSPLHRRVTASKATCLYLYDGPDQYGERPVDLSGEERGFSGKPETYRYTHGRPEWLVAVRGHAVPGDFPDADREAFSIWFDRWAEETGAEIICDYRAEALAGKPFTPTTDWQEAPSDAVLPAGLQIRVNVASGRKEARVLP